MDLKSKRIVGISQSIIFASILVLYTRIGGMGMICVAGSMELFLVITYIFMGGIPDAMESMVQARQKRGQLDGAHTVEKAGILYGVVSAIMTEAALLAVNRLLVDQSGLNYVDKMLELLMLSVPFIAILQVLRGIIQVDLDRMVIGISRFVFVICMVIGVLVSYFILADYGTKVAALMQSVRKWHFYVVLGLVPGVMLGAIGSIVFLLVIAFMRREQISLWDRPVGMQKESVWSVCRKLFVSQLTKGMVDWLKRIPLLAALWLSLGEIAGENYLFGNFYGAVLPVLGLVWSLFDFVLVSYKKRLYAAYRKKMEKQYYKDLKSVLCYVLLGSVLTFVLTLALHKSFLAIWSQQTFVAFMKLMASSSVIGLLGLPCLVLMDVLKYRNLHTERMVAALGGTCVGVLASIICAKTLGAGILMYVLSISLQLVVMIAVSAWNLSAVVGINYLSVISRTAAGVGATVVIGLLAFVAQKVLFTALGGFTTLLLCTGLGVILQLISVLALRVFDKEELAVFSMPFLSQKL